MPIQPIMHDLEYDSNYVTSTLEAVDMTYHYAAFLRNLDAEGIENLVDDNDALVESMHELFENDHSLLDDAGERYPWYAYGLDLVADLSKSLGLDPEKQEAVGLVARWLEDPVHRENSAKHAKSVSRALEKDLEEILSSYGVGENPDLLITIFRTLLNRAGAFGAVTCAISECGRADPTGALRASAELESRRT